MALKIVWSLQAEKGFSNVLNYLENEWTSKEILELENNIKELLFKISKYPEMCPRTGKFKNLHKGLIDKNNYIIYKVNYDKKRIEIVNFRGTKQKPLNL